MKDILTKAVINAIIGLIALIIFGYFTHYMAAISLFVLFWVNNIDSSMKIKITKYKDSL